MNAIPEGYHTLTPVSIVEGCSQAVEFYKQIFGARERMRFEGPGGTIAHCELEIGDSVLMLADPQDNNRPMPARLMLYVVDCDEIFNRAVQAGARIKDPVATKFYGDRSGSLVDPFGLEWVISTHVEDVSLDEMYRRAEQGESASPP